MPDLRPYAGRWVALVAGQVAGSGRTPAQARQMASRNRPKERQEIGFVHSGAEIDLTTQLPIPNLMLSLRPLLSQSPDPVYLVGGAVRDTLLGRTGSHDLDFVVGGDAVQLARMLADALNGAFYLLDADRGTARVILPDATLDFARFRGENLIEDLRDRDFTINAIALPTESMDIDDIIDPMGGQEDLTSGLIRATGPLAVHTDPVRALRAVRLAAELDLKILPETADLIRASSRRLWTVSAERVRDEVVRLLAAPGPADSLRHLDDLHLLPQIFPELVITKGVSQSLPHQVDVFDHTILMVQALEALLEAIQRLDRGDNLPLTMAGEALGPYSTALQAHIDRKTAGGRSGRSLLFLGAILHDVGKPGKATEDENGRIRFTNHEELGARIGQRRAQELALSNIEVRQIATMVRHHMRPAWLACSSSDGRPSRRSIYRFFRDVEANGLDICLLCLADGLSKGSPPDLEDWERRLRSVVALLEHFLYHHTETIAPPLLLDGWQLMRALDLPAGPIVGRLLELIREAQAAGEVNTLDGALALARAAQIEIADTD